MKNKEKINLFKRKSISFYWSNIDIFFYNKNKNISTIQLNKNQNNKMFFFSSLNSRFEKEKETKLFFIFKRFSKKKIDEKKKFLLLIFTNELNLRIDLIFQLLIWSIEKKILIEY